MDLKSPQRVSRSFTQRLTAGPERVFPLLCPVRESEWIPEWDPTLILTQSGGAELDCVFVTAAIPHAAIWYITRHETEIFLIEMIKITPEVTACRITIQLSQMEDGTAATITYTHTSLGPRGDDFLKSFSHAYFDTYMRTWEARLNHFLAYGGQLN